jgi:hypothetical protein
MEPPLSESEDSSSQSSETDEETDEEVDFDTGISSSHTTQQPIIPDLDCNASGSKVSEQKEVIAEEVHESIQHPVVGKSTFNLHESLHNTLSGGFVRSKSG